MQKNNRHIRFFYNRISPVYMLIDLFLKRRKINLIERISKEPKGTLLEIGIGAGSHIPYYKSHHVLGIDLSEKMLSKAATKTKNTAIQLKQMDGELLQFPQNSFDYILISHVLSVTSNPEKMITEVKRVLKDDGKLYILNHNTPNNLLKYLDRLFQCIAKYFHFSSYFKVKEIQSLQQFQLLSETDLDQFAYTKLFVFQK